MPTPLLRRAAVIVLLLCLASPAWAGQTVEGEGYEFVLPDGYRKAMSGSFDGGFLNQHGMGLLDSANMAFFVRGGLESSGQNMLAVVSIEADSSLTRRYGGDLSLDALESELRMKAGGLGLGDAAPTFRRVKIAEGGPALELSMQQDAGDQGVFAIRIAIAIKGDRVVQLMQIEPLDGDGSVTWDQALASLRVRGPSLWQLTKRYGIFVLAGLAFLLFIILKVRSASAARKAWRAPASSTAPAWEAGAVTATGEFGISRASDGLPVYDGDGAEIATREKPSVVRGEVERAPAPARRRTTRRLPTDAPDTWGAVDKKARTPHPSQIGGAIDSGAPEPSEPGRQVVKGPSLGLPRSAPKGAKPVQPTGPSGVTPLPRPRLAPRPPEDGVGSPATSLPTNVARRETGSTPLGRPDDERSAAGEKPGEKSRFERNSDFLG